MNAAENLFGMKSRRRCTIGLFILLAGLMVCGSRVSAQLFQVATDKNVYVQGETIKILVTYTGSEWLGFATSRQSNYTLDGIYTPGGIVLMVLTMAQGPCTWTNIFHDGGEYSLTPGEHSVVGIVEDIGSSSPVGFTVIPEPKPQADFLLDFLHYPGTTNLIPTLVAYNAYGVQFPYGDVAHEPGYDYVSGFEMTTEFSISVMGVRARVRATSDWTLTLIARDAQGQELGRVAPLVLGEAQQTIEFRSESSIASLEWLTSPVNAIVKIDSLWVQIPPILNPSVSNDTFRLMWQSVTGETYQVWSSSNLLDWILAGAAIECTQEVLINEYPITEENGLFYRISRTQAP